MVGYSAMVERDESTALRVLDEHFQLVRDVLPRFGGREIKTIGDAFMLEFASVQAATACAIAIQQRHFQRNVEAGEPRRFQIRIGIHVGDVEERGEDVFGNGVNIASRVQPLAPAGGIAVTMHVHGQLNARLGDCFCSIGKQSLKNIATPIEVFVSDHESLRGIAVEELSSPAALGTRAPRPGSVTTSRMVSICVLPFANMSGDPEQEYFTDGITEDIITDLSKVSALSVVSRNTSFTYKGKAAELSEIARQLQVSHVLEGSVRKSGNRVRITAKLIECSRDDHLWAERYDRDLNDIFTLQDEISTAIVAALRLQLLPSEKQAIESRSTTNAQAYTLYLMARRYHLAGNVLHRDVVVRLCRRAIEVDPKYARAWALLAICQSNIRALSGRAGDDGWAAAEQALSLDPDLAEAHAAKGRLLADLGRYEEAGIEHEHALRLDANSYEVNTAAARYFMAVRRHHDAVRVLERAADLAESDFWAPGMLMQCHGVLGNRAGERRAARRSIERTEKLLATDPVHSDALSMGVKALVTLGERDRAMEWAEHAMLLDPDNQRVLYNISCNMVLIGERDRALELLGQVMKAIQRPAFEWLKTDTDFDAIRDDPRFQALTAETELRLSAEEEAAARPGPRPDTALSPGTRDSGR